MKLSAIKRNSVAIAGIVGLGVLFLAQRQMEKHLWTASALLGILVGWGIWLWCIERQPPTPDHLPELQPQVFDRTRLRLGLMAASIVVAILTWFSLSTRETPIGGDVGPAYSFGPGNNITMPSVIGWLLAIGLWFAATWSWQPFRLPKADPSETRKSWLAFGLLTLITIAGGWLLFHRLYQTPNDMTQDHAWKLLDIINILNGGRPLFLPNNTGREPGQFYYIATLIKLFNLNRDFMALKIGNAIIGTITIPIVYLLGRELGGRKIGLIAASLYAMSKWAWATTRMGLRYPYAPLPAALVIWHLLRYVRMGKRTDVLWAGWWLGVGLYGYIGIRIVPLVITMIFVLMLFDRRRRGMEAFKVLATHALMLLITTTLVFLPLGHFMVQYPELFWFRVATRTTDTERSIAQSACADFYKKLGQNFVTEHPNEPNPYENKQINGTVCKLQIFGYNNLNMLKSFNWMGDISQVNAVSLDILVDVMTATLLLAAVPYLLWRLFWERSLRWWMAAFALPILAMTSTLNIAFFIENPSTPRAAIMMPMLFVVAAAPLALLTEWIVGVGRKAMFVPARWAVAAIVTVAMLGYGVQQNYVRYFRDFHIQYRNFVPISGEISSAILAYEQRGLDRNDAYIFVWRYWLEGRSISVYMNDIHWHESHFINTDQPLVEPNGKPLLYVINQEDQARLTELQTRFPQGELKRVDSVVPNKWFYTFFIP